MKETRTINLNGLVYNIDADAYERLKAYFADIENRIAADLKADVMQDVEARVGELFNKKLFAAGVQVVDITMVEQVISQIGAPDAFGEQINTAKVTPQKPKSAPKQHGCLRAIGLALLIIMVLTIIPVLIPIVFALGVGGIALSAVGLHLLPLFLAIGIPVFVIVYLIVYWVRNRKTPKASFWIISIVCWILSLVWCGHSVQNIAKDLAIPGIAGLSNAISGIASGIFDSDADEVGDMMDQVCMLSDFDAIEVDGSAELKLKQGSVYSVTLHGNNLSAVNAEVQDNILRISNTAGVRYQQLVVEVTLPTLTSLRLQGASDVDTEGSFVGDSLNVYIAGAAKLDMDLHYTAVEIKAAGASAVDLKGTAEHLVITTMGAADIDAEDLVSQYAKINCSGGTKAKINCQQTLSAQAAGASKIRYKGKPAVEKQIAVGSSSIKAL